MIKVLNHGFVELVDAMGSDSSIVRAARVSYAAENNGTNHGPDRNLLRYLLVNKHTSPFEHVVFTFHVKAPLFVFRQWQRHRTWSFNEVSARYTELPDEFYVPEKGTIGVQSKSSKQARDIKENDTDEIVREHMQFATRASFNTYRILLDTYKVPRELARSVLPLSTYSCMYATVDLHNLMHFLELRLHKHAQYEIRVYAEAVLELVKKLVPITIEEWTLLTPSTTEAHRRVTCGLIR